MRILATFLVASVAFVSMGCVTAITDPLGRLAALDDAQRRYTELVRWGEIERASNYVDPELQAAYLDNLDAFTGIRVTDFESGRMNLSEDGDSGTVIVVYRAYSMSTLVEKTMRESQEWYRVPGMANDWRVRPDLRQIVNGVTGRH